MQSSTVFVRSTACLVHLHHVLGLFASQPWVVGRNRMARSCAGTYSEHSQLQVQLPSQKDACAAIPGDSVSSACEVRALQALAARAILVSPYRANSS
eukprot:5962506-Amphidinium_carterae.1